MTGVPLNFVEELLAHGPVTVFLLGCFVVSQSWILWTLGASGHDVGRLQTICLLNPNPSSTGMVARQILQQWTIDDIRRFQRHFVIDLWIHPVIYCLFLSSALWHDLAKRQPQCKDFSRRITNGRIATVLIFLGGIFDIQENIRHSSIQFEPALEATDELLWKACGFATAKWALMGGVCGWLVWRYYFCSNHAKLSYTRNASQQAGTKFSQGPNWIGPRPEDHLNTPCAAWGLLEVQGRSIPWIVSAPNSYLDAERSYVVSPYAHYIGYGIDEIRMHLADKPVMQFLALTIVRLVGWVFRMLSFDDCIYFNNLLLSTNLWPNTIEWSAELLDEINGTLQDKATRAANDGIPRAIVWRSVDPLSQPKLTELLRECKSCLMIHARIINWADYSCENPSMESELCQKRDLKNDIKLFRRQVGWDFLGQKNAPNWEQSKYEMATMAPNDLMMEEAEQIVDLFNQLYLVKYSRRNPHLTPEGLIRLAKTGFLEVCVLRFRQPISAGECRGRIVAFSACSTTDGVRTASFIGYDVAGNVDKDLYRLVMMLVRCTLIRDGVRKCHHSGGANAFKRNRGATSAVEYIAVFVDHLPLFKQLPWRVAKWLGGSIITVKNAR
jgi:hypothetical protein